MPLQMSLPVLNQTIWYSFVSRLNSRSSLFFATKTRTAVEQAVFINEPEVKEFLSDPMGRRKEKRQVIEELKDSANLSEHTINFLKVLLQDGKLSDASNIFNNFETLYCQRTATEVVSISSFV